MSNRLADLQRQRALAQEQLAWIESEIAREAGQALSPTPPASTSAVPIAPTATANQIARDAAIARTADEIMAQYQRAPGDAAKDTKKGCYLWFAFLMLTVVLFGIGVYLFYGKK